MFVFALALTVVSNTLYHLFQKATAQNVNPALALAMTYGVAAVVCVLLLPFIPLKTTLGQSLRQINWASYALGIAIVGLELGYLLAYRVGWELSVAGLISNVIVALVLLPIGIMLYKEQLSPINLIGIAVCILGLIMINWKS